MGKKEVIGLIRERIIEGAIEEVNEKGHRFTMDDLAKRLGVSKRSIYENFNSKEQLISTIIDVVISKIMEKDEEIFNDEGLSSIGKLRQIALVIENELEYVSESAIYEVERYYPNQWQKVKELFNKREIMQRKIIEKGIREGELKNINPSILIKVLNQEKSWIIDRNFLRENNLTLYEAWKSLVDIVLFGIDKN